MDRTQPPPLQPAASEQDAIEKILAEAENSPPHRMEQGLLGLAGFSRSANVGGAPVPAMRKTSLAQHQSEEATSSTNNPLASGQD
jgi:hypothetical protein